MTGSRWGRGPPHPSPPKKKKKIYSRGILFQGWFEQFELFKEHKYFWAFGPLKLRKPASGQRYRRGNTNHTCFWHPHLHSFISLCLWFLNLPLPASPLSSWFAFYFFFFFTSSFRPPIVHDVSLSKRFYFTNLRLYSVLQVLHVVG